MIRYSFATGNTNPETFPADAFGEAAARVLPTMAADLNQYPGKLGHEGMRRLMAEREFDREGVRIDPDHIVLTNGSMQAVTLAAEVASQGNDLVVMEEYSYVGSIRAFDAMGIEMVGVPLDEEGMRMDALAETLERLAQEGRPTPFIYTLATYQNPTGAVMSRERRLKLIELARRYDCIVVEDNCYGDVHFDGDKQPALYALDDDPRHIYLCSLSKIFAPGVRLGYLTASPALLERVLARRHDAGPNTLAAAITYEYLHDKLWQHVEMANDALKQKRDTMLNALNRHLGNECSFSHPPGGLFIWVRLPDDVDPGRVQEIAEENEVSIAHGSDFHIRNDAGPFIRLAFGYPTVDEIEAGIALLGESVRQARGSATL